VYFNIYTFLVDNKKTLPLKDDFVYLPLTYFLVGGYQIFATPILGKGFDAWLANADYNLVVADPNVFKYLVILKLPYLILDIAIAFLLLRYFKDKEKGQKVFTLWLFNPFTIFIIYAFSNVDLYAVFFTVIAFLFINKLKLIPAAIFLGIAACSKLYPLLFCAIFYFLKGQNVREKIVVSLVPICILGAIIFTFLVPSLYSIGSSFRFNHKNL